MTDKNHPPASDETHKTDREKNIRRAGVAVGIGSAAIAAALLYTNRRKDQRKS